MAAEMVSSAVAQEAVNQVLSRIKEAYQEKQSDAKEQIERMEIAHIKLEAALETSNKWDVTSVPLLRWRSKLKRAAQECDRTVRQCRQRLEEEEEAKQGVRCSPFPKRVAHTAMSFVSSIFSGSNDDELTRFTTVRPFERFAEGASEFLRYVEIGGTPCRYMFFAPLIRHLLAVKGTKYCFVHGGQHLSLILQPFCLPNHGMEGILTFLLEDGNAPENNFLLMLCLRLSECTDIFGVAVRCLQLFVPYLSSIAETVKTKLTKVPMQDLGWVVSDANLTFGCDEQHINLHAMCSKWFRPNLFCCQQQNVHCNHSSSSESLPCDIYMEPVIQVYLLGHVAPTVGNNRRHSAVTHGDSQTSPKRGFPYLKIGGHFWPHASYDDFSAGVSSSASVMINFEAKQCKQHGMYANISFEHLGEIMITKAVDCLRRNIAATSYQTLWKSKHGGAYLQVEKASWTATTRKGKVGKRPKLPVKGCISMYHAFISSWILHAPAQIQRSAIEYWIHQKGKQSIVLSFLKTNACVHDCPIVLLSLQDHGALASKFKLSSTFNA